MDGQTQVHSMHWLLLILLFLESHTSFQLLILLTNGSPRPTTEHMAMDPQRGWFPKAAFSQNSCLKFPLWSSTLVVDVFGFVHFPASSHLPNWARISEKLLEILFPVLPLPIQDLYFICCSHFCVKSSSYNKSSCPQDLNSSVLLTEIKCMHLLNQFNSQCRPIFYTPQGDIKRKCSRTIET